MEYVEAPFAVMVKLDPLQIDPLFTEMTGNATTVTLLTAATDETHPLALVPVTEYALVEVGATVEEPLL